MRVWMLLFAVGCSGAQDVRIERDQLKDQVKDLQSKNEKLEHEAAGLNAQVRRMQRDLDDAHRQVAYAGLGIAAGDTLSARLTTTKGTITCELWPDKSPVTVLNFVQLAEGKKAWTDPVTKQETTRPLYDGTTFHRVIPNFMIQGGDPLGNGLGGPGYEFADEANGLAFKEPGLLAMANAGPNTNGSQFFITDRSTPHQLDGKHTIFGKCDHPDVVQAIAESERDENDKPLKPVVLQSVRISRAKPR